MVDDRGAVFALLDDCDATAARRSSRLYTQFLHERVCADVAQLDAVCAAVAADLRRGLHAVVLGEYEFGRQLVLERAAQASGGESVGEQKTQRGDATLRFLLFERCAKLSREEADAWLTQCDGGAAQPSVAGTAGVRASVDPAQFDAAIGAIHEALRIGDSYQVNYTYRLGFDVFGTPAGLYRRLRERQPVPFGALIALPDDRWVLSCSPELFVEKTGARLRARPMKGTAPRTPDDSVADRGAAEFLVNDPKNRAENVMIVDLLRNDLSRVAETGSVKVPALFSVEPYASVWQMTSTVEATLRARTSFADVLRALFPCGSITGAPKHRTVQLIDTLESTPRGLYTGTIGWLDAVDVPATCGSADLPGGSSHASAPALSSAAQDACGDFCLSVAIRTLTLDAPARGASERRGSMGVGAGIVLDSVAADEYAECELKARFLTDADPGFELFETMYATREDGIRHLERHLARLARSAAWLGFRFDEAGLRERLEAQCALLAAGMPHRVRLALAKSGTVQLSAAPLMPLADSVVGVLLAPDHGFTATEASDLLLHHKTTRRAEYDRGWRNAEALGAFDTLFFNERGELTEGGRSNVFVKLAGRWWTPPLSSGVLPGVMRGVLLEDSELGAAERALTRSDVLNAEALLVCNALRGAVAARVL
ncbi:chorismate-binding protein [Paraburkholderia phenazinium]|uniref:Para-aminobenzoate synthetase / 4-amino-4-deoxychorismate lyase n=1 Tax=Paraburkholderia phenazinium TaxID=60549 RepID=A0A1G8CKT3_9BURK|nr:bifunctional anthranilate synthase component I family protein/class IV aminotransferase [Paraburkholderia phenazinium]SDH45996.1 para-aminobenzoate synthetase / 4-amino-4-deoxychorismate lyase [Paraburkholderia phenazinium]